MFLSICDSPEILSVIRIVKIIINIIMVIAPIILIISLMFSFASAVKSNDDGALVKEFRNSIPKIIATLLIFFVPTIINVILSITLNVPYKQCFSSATPEGINNAYATLAKNELANARNSLKDSDYQRAKRAINKIKDASTKNELNNELNEIKSYIDLINEINALEKNFNSKKYLELRNKIDNIQDETIKDKLKKYFEDHIKLKIYAKVTPSGTLKSFNIRSLKCPVYYGSKKQNRYTFTFDSNVGEQLFLIFNDLCDFVDQNPYISYLQDDGFAVGKEGYHGLGLAFDLNDHWTYTDPNTNKTYGPYAGQGPNTWSRYTKFICEVCDGKEDCDQNVNYQIFKIYFEQSGWCWGGNWYSEWFDPMHFEYRNGACSVKEPTPIQCN